MRKINKKIFEYGVVALASGIVYFSLAYLGTVTEGRPRESVTNYPRFVRVGDRELYLEKDSLGNVVALRGIKESFVNENLLKNERVSSQKHVLPDSVAQIAENVDREISRLSESLDDLVK